MLTQSVLGGVIALWGLVSLKRVEAPDRLMWVDMMKDDRKPQAGTRRGGRPVCLEETSAADTAALGAGVVVVAMFHLL